MSTAEAAHEALDRWCDVVNRVVLLDGPDLSQRQLAILLNVYLKPPPHTVRGLATDLNVSKAVITRALDTLGQRGLLKRKRDEDDKRSVFVQRTVKGAVYLRDMGDLIADAWGMTSDPTP